VSNTIRIKRRAAGGSTGAPASLENAELAYNESDAGNGILYYGYGTGGVGGSATSVVAIGGDGAFVNLTGAQTISGNKTFTGTVNLSGATLSGNTTFSNNLTVSGDLTVNGTLTSISSTTLEVEDKNIELGKVTTPSDATADGGGITLLGTTNKTINWIDATDAWTFSEHINIASGKEYRIDGTKVLDATSLGSAVVASSLTSVGTIGTGVWQGTAIGTAYGGTGQTTYTDGQLLIGNTATGSLSKSTLTAGANITITNGNGTVTIAAAAGEMVAGDGIDVTGTTVSVDLKANGGLVIESTELALDLSASSITGTLAVADGGTGATDASTARTNLGLAIGTNVQAYDADLDALSGMQTGAASALALLTSTEIAILDGATVTTAELNIIDGSTSATATTLAQADRMVINDNGTMVQVALSDLVTFLEDGATSGFDIDGGTF
jgi:hypothetical protein